MARMAQPTTTMKCNGPPMSISRISGLKMKMNGSSTVRNSYQVPCQPTRIGSAPAIAAAA